MSTWKTRDETFHGSKWGYVVVFLVIAVVLTLLSSIFYLMGEGLRGMEITEETAGTYFLGGSAAIVVIFVLLIVFIKVGILALATVTGFFSAIHGFLTALFTNIYILVFTVVLIVVLLIALSGAVYANFEINLTNPIVIGILVVLLIIIFPFAIFIIDQFSWEHD